MHPYRELPALAARAPGITSPEELILYGLLVVIGAIPVALALLEGDSFGVDATVGALMVCAGVLGAIGYAWRAGTRSQIE